MANTHILIASATLTSNSSFIEITGISTSYPALRIITMLRSDVASTQDILKIDINNGGSGFYDVWMGSNGSEFSGSDGASAGAAFNASTICGANSPANTYGFMDFYAPYNTTGNFDNGHIYHWKSVNPYDSNIESQVRVNAGLHFATDNLQSIKFSPSTGTNLVTGSQVWVYGMLNT